MQTHNRGRQQAGISTIAAVAALSAIMVTFLIIFLLSNSGGNKGGNGADNTGQTDNGDDNTQAESEPLYIRIPQSSYIYSSDKYNFSLAYPDTFQGLKEADGSSDTMLFRAESALAAGKPVGNSGAAMNGQFGIYVYRKSEFKLIIADPNVFVGPTTTGNDTTWKIVSGDAGSNYQLGNAYDVKSSTSQAGVKVFQFPRTQNGQLTGRLAFQTGDYYVLIALPAVYRPNGGDLTQSEIAAYNVILSNIAATVRVPTAAQTQD